MSWGAVSCRNVLLRAEGPPVAGFLGGVRDVNCHCGTLDDVPDDLTIQAERLTAFGGVVMYAFEVRAGTRPLIEGRATVVLQVGA